MPFELRDIGMVKLFMADALPADEAAALLAAVRRCSEERVSALREVEQVAQLTEQASAGVSAADAQDGHRLPPGPG
jgi:hypothetical protein